MRPAAVLFDLDGVLADSEPLHLASERAALAHFGVELTEVAKRQFVGRSSADIVDGFIELFELDTTPAELAALMHHYHAELLPGVQGFAATTDLVTRLRVAGVPLAVASGSTPAGIAVSLDAIGLAADFPVRVSAEEVLAGKPAPDIFLEAARRLGVEPGGCVVIEDAAPGVTAALAAGMRCVAIPTITDPLGEVFGSADLLFPGGMATVDVDAVMAFLLPDD